MYYSHQIVVRPISLVLFAPTMVRINGKLEIRTSGAHELCKLYSHHHTLGDGANKNTLIKGTNGANKNCLTIRTTYQ